MNEWAMKVQAVLNTLELLNMPSTYDNVNHMLGIYNTLTEVRNYLNKPVEVVEDGGEADPD